MRGKGEAVRSRRERGRGLGGDGTRPSRWGHATRAAWALGPATMMTIGSGSEGTLVCVAVGGCAVYVMDVTRQGEWAVFSAWASATAALGTLLGGRGNPGVSSMVTSTGVFASHGVILFAFCAWFTLQFRWIHVMHPGAATACERAVFGLTPPACGAIFTWAFASSSVGEESAALCGLFVCLITHRMFLFPTVSGCRFVGDEKERRRRENRFVLTERQAKWSTVTTLTLPIALYVLTNFWTLTSSMDHAFACLALVTIPVLYLIALGTEKSLWWWRRADEEAAKRIEISILLLALTGFALSVEGGIIFSEFSEYIEIMAPLNYIMVAVSVHTALAAFVACYTNSVGVSVPESAVQIALAISGGTALSAIGAPMWMIPVPIPGSIYFVKYYYQQGSAREYGIFAASCAACFTWFLSKNFWSLDVKVGSLTIDQMCFAALALVAMALALPIATSTKSIPARVMGVGVAGYVSLLAIVEQILSQATRDDDFLIYPPYLVLATSLSGFLTSRSLVISGRMSRNFGWIVQSACGAKLSMLFVHGFMEMFSVFVVVMVMTAPYVMSKHMIRGISGADCIVYTVVLVMSLTFARFAMFDILFELTGHRPTDATLFGGLLLITGTSLAFVLSKPNFDGDVFGKRLLVLLISTGLFLVTFRPPLPWKGEVGAWYDAEHVPDTEIDEARMYGARDTPHHGWPSWLLMLAGLTAMFAMSSPQKQTASISALRCVFGAICGGCVGLYMALEYFVEQTGLTILLFVACALVGVFLSFTYSPSPTSSRWLPYVYCAFVCILSLAYVSQMGGSSEDIDEVEEGIEGRFGVVSVFAGTSLQIAFALKFRVQSSLKTTRQRQKRRGGSSPFLPATGRSRPEYFRSVTSRNEHRELKARDLSWMPIIGNVATLTSFVACVVLSDEFADGSVFSVFVLAPILLLLHQDSVIFPILEDSQRYAPPAAVVVGKLCYDAFVAVLAGPNRVHVLAAAASKWPWMMVNTLSLFLASVSSINFVHFLATGVRTDGMTLILTAPLSLLSPFLSNISAVRALAAASFIAVLTQHALQRRAKIVGLKYL